MLTFWEWLGQGYEFGFVQELQRLLFREMRGDEGYQYLFTTRLSAAT